MPDSNQIKPILDAAWRRRWLILLPPVLGALIGWAWVQRIPKEYRATTSIRVVAQRVPKEILQSTVTAGPAEIIASLKVQILSDSYINDVVQQIGMVPAFPTSSLLEEARIELRRKIEIEVDTQRFSYFKISVRHREGKLAAKAANRLADLFIQENTKLRTEQAQGTEGLVDDLAMKRKTELDAVERRLADYKRAHQGELPEQQAANQTLITTYQTQMQALNDQVRTRQGEIEMLRAQSETADAIAGIVGVPGAGGDPLLRALQGARAELQQLLLRYSEEHPDVRRKRAEVDRLEEQHQRQIASGPAGVGTAKLSPNASPTEVRIALAQAEIAEFERKRIDLQVKIDGLVARVRNAPLVEVELNEIMRAYNEARNSYDELRKRREAAEQGRELEESGQGEQFRIQDRATPQRKPASPNVPAWVFGGLLIGLAFGGGVAFGFEYFDPSIRSEETFHHAFPDVPLLVAIPTMARADETSNKKGQPSRTKHSSAAMMVLGFLAAFLFV